jgi:integrase
MQKLMKACESATGRIGDIPAADWWSALVSVIYDCGERISAVLSITPSDIDADGGLTVRGEYRKGKTRDRRYKLRQKTIQRLAVIKPKSGAFFRLPFSKCLLFSKFGKILERAGLPNTRRDKFHKIRRTTASNFEAAGGNATQLLDHTDRRTTEAYLDPRVLKEIHPADIVLGIGETELPSKCKQTEPPRDEILEQFRLFLESRESNHGR